MENINVLMCGSNLNVKGGMVSVVKNYLEYDSWNEFNIIYIPTHIEKNKILVSIYFLRAYFQIAKLVRKKSIKIAHLHTAEKGSFYRKAILARFLTKRGIKTIMHHHAAEFESFYNNSSDRQKKYIKNTLELVSLNIVLSNRQIPMISQKAPAANVEVLYNAVPTYRTNLYNLDANGILFLGRLGQRKGIYDLLETIKNIDNYIDNNIKFYICGDGEIEKVKRRIRELEIDHRIGYVGWIDNKQKEYIYPKIMISVLPSYHEGLPMSILETMAYGIPNISTNIASIPEVIFNGENGFLISPGDIRDLSHKIIELSSKNELRKQFSLQAYEFINNFFSIENNFNQLKNIYLNLFQE